MTDLMGLYAIAERDGISVDCFDLRKREALSVMDESGECHIAINPLKLDSSVDEKMKLGHELGHCETGAFYNEYAACDIRQKHENRADKWAISRLVPEDELKEAVGCGYTQSWQLAEYFDVPEDFMHKAMWFYQYGNLAMEY